MQKPTQVVALLSSTLLLLFCLDSSLFSDDRRSKPATTQVTMSSEHSPPVPEYPLEVNRLIYSLPGWERASFTDEQWQSYIHAAELLQRAKPTTVERALKDYVIHFMTAFEEGVDGIYELSKPFILLRVMFDLPQTPETSRMHENSPGTGFATRPINVESENLADTTSYPLRWKEDGPELLAEPAGYNGGPYPAAGEYRYFLKHFRYRSFQSSAASRPAETHPG